MRKYMLLIGFFILISSCQNQDYNYDYEDKAIRCLKEVASKQNIDLSKEFKKFENYLIAQKILSDNSGDSYIKIYEQIKMTGNINSSFTYNFEDSTITDKELLEIKLPCSDIINNPDNYKFYSFSKIAKIKKEMDSIANYSDSYDVSILVDVILNNLDARDLEHEYYKYTTLLLLNDIQDVHSGFLDEFLHTPNHEPFYTQNYHMKVIVNEFDQLTVNGVIFPIDSLINCTRDYISVHKDSSVISFQNYRKTSYSKYIKVQNCLIAGIKLKRNEYAMEKYGLDYSQLKNSQKEEINNIFPFCIREVEFK